VAPSRWLRSSAANLAGKVLIDLALGTRNVKQTMARTEPDTLGNPYAEWQCVNLFHQ
jgi:hypothetical protein